MICPTFMPFCFNFLNFLSTIHQTFIFAYSSRHDMYSTCQSCKKSYTHESDRSISICLQSSTHTPTICSTTELVNCTYCNSVLSIIQCVQNVSDCTMGGWQNWDNNIEFPFPIVCYLFYERHIVRLIELFECWLFAVTIGHWSASQLLDRNDRVGLWKSMNNTRAVRSDYCCIGLGMFLVLMWNTEWRLCNNKVNILK